MSIVTNGNPHAKQKPPNFMAKPGRHLYKSRPNASKMQRRRPHLCGHTLFSNSSAITTTLNMSLLSISFLTILSIVTLMQHVNATSIKPSDFDRYVMSCYLGGSGGSNNYPMASDRSSSPYGGSPMSSNPGGLTGNPQAGGSIAANGAASGSSGGYGGNAMSPLGGAQFGRASNGGYNGQQQGLSLQSPNGAGAGGYQPTYYAQDTSRLGGRQDGLSNLGQQIPRANTIDNFIALVGKIEAANPRLANNVDQLIRILLGRFRLDNYYYDVRSRTPISETDHRTTDIIPALLNSMGYGQQQMQPQYILSADVFPEQLLDHDEKCSMYFMLSHFIDKTSASNPTFNGAPVAQMTVPQENRKPPSLQAAGAPYPAQSANNAFSGGARYPGPSPSFGSPATNNMNSFGVGLNANPDSSMGKNPYGMNAPQPNNQQLFNQNYNNLRNTGQYSGTLSSNNRFAPPYIDGGARSRDERSATEFGVVTVANQENAAIVLNRVLMGILAASLPPQTIRQLAATIYPTQSLTSTPKIDEEIDPLYAVTLADLWAISSIPKAGKPLDIRMLGDNGRWNDTMCPTSFHLERSNSIRFTTAELLGGLDGFNLGMFRRRLMGLRKNIRLSEMLKIYYSKTGFRPQFAEVGVCNRVSAISTQLDDLHRQTENYLRLYQLNLPIADNEIAITINRVDAFKDIARQAAQQYAPPDICVESSFNEVYPMSPQEQCEIGKADVVTVLDASPQANQAFMNMFVAILSRKLGLSRDSSSLTVLTNQQDTTGYAGAYSFNAIVRNSTNTAEIGCALVHDRSQTYQGGQVSDPIRLMEMFERALINLDSEYLTRQTATSGSTLFGGRNPSSFMSSMFQAESSYNMFGPAPRNTGGAKVIIWFNYGSQLRPSQIAPSPTNWNNPSYSNSLSGDSQYKFEEAKKYLRENFRGASILAVTSSREDVKAYVYDEDRDIFTDIPQGSSDTSLSSESYYPSSSYNPSTNPALTGPAEQLVSKLLQRMCDIPSMFQYPMCFRGPSENTVAVGYISPGRKQNWMMSPKTFFASRAIRMAFKVDGGRLRVCFGRRPKPDETYNQNNHQQQQQPYQLSGSGGISLNNGQSPPPTQAPVAVSASSSDYYTGLDYGVCKDVSPGQEIDFIVADPCYKKSIAECEPFYFVIREISNPGEGDMNYMCKDDGCKRFDQVKFIMTHSGVTCSSALSFLQTNWKLLMISVFASIAFSGHGEANILSPNRLNSWSSLATASILGVVSLCICINQVAAQQSNVYDFGQNRYGEKRGNFTPSEVLAMILVAMTIVAGLALTVGLCYYITKLRTRGMTEVKQEDY